jgi:hypothetical protein
MKVPTTCPACHQTTQLEVDGVGYQLWQRGEFIQNALPELSASDRERLMTGYCPQCWKNDFPDEEDDRDSWSFAEFFLPGSERKDQP